MGCWYEDHFQEDYLKIYNHRNNNAGTELQNIMNFIPYKERQKILDLCCGAGRHSRWFADQKLEVTGVDLSIALLQEAKKQLNSEEITYVRSDMREINFDNEFDIVANLFTSFGYFEEDSENERVFSRVYSALKKGGYFLFDYLNPLFIEGNLVPFSQNSIDDTTIYEYRKIIKDTVVKRIIMKDLYSKRSYEERVKLYSEKQIKKMLERNNLKPLHLFGNYDGSPYFARSSPRLIYICQK